MTANEVGFVDNIMNIDKYVNQIQEDVKNIYNVGVFMYIPVYSSLPQCLSFFPLLFTFSIYII